MTLLHQAAQKAVEQLKRLTDGRGGIAHFARTTEQAGTVRELIAALESALHQQSEAAKWERERAGCPALQHQEVPREPVAKDVRVSDFIAGAAWHMANPDESLDALQEAAEWWATEHASPSTTRQQEVGSEAKARALEVARLFRQFTKSSHRFYDGRPLHVVAAELLEMLAAAPSTPEKAGGVSDGVGGNDGR